MKGPFARGQLSKYAKRRYFPLLNVFKKFKFEILKTLLTFTFVLALDLLWEKISKLSYHWMVISGM